MTGTDVVVMAENLATYILFLTSTRSSPAKMTRAPSNNEKLSLVVSEATSDESDADANEVATGHSTVIVRVEVPVMSVM